MSQPSIQELTEAIQQFKLYVQQNFPYKQTSYSGQEDPTVLPGKVAPVGATYNQFFGNDLVKVWVKQSASDTDWTDQASGGSSGVAFSAWQPNTLYVSFATEGVPALVWEPVTEKFYHNLEDFTSSATFAEDLALDRWLGLGGGGGENPMLPIGIWDASPTENKITPVETYNSSFIQNSPNDYTLTPAADSYAGTGMAVVAGAPIVTLNSGYLWSRIQLNTSSTLQSTGLFLANGDATIEDVILSLSNMACMNTCTQVALLHISPSDIGKVNGLVLDADGARYCYEDVGVTFQNNDPIYVGLDSTTGDLLVQVGLSNVLNLSPALGGRGLDITELGSESLKVGAFLIMDSEPDATSDTYFDLACSDSGRTPFRQLIPAELPADTTDGKRYLISGKGSFGSTPLAVDDVVEFRNSGANVVVTRGINHETLIPWDIDKTVETKPAIPVDTYGTATITGVSPGPYTLQPTANLNEAGWSAASSGPGVEGPSQSLFRVYTASCVWPDTSLDIDGNFSATGFLLISDGSTYEDFEAYLLGGIQNRPFSALAILIEESNYQWVTVDTTGSLDSGSYSWGSPMQAGDTAYLQFDTNGGFVYISKTGQGSSWVRTIPTLPADQKLRIAFIGVYSENPTVPAEELPSLEFTFHNTEDSNTGFHRMETFLPGGATAGTHYQLTADGTYNLKRLSKGDVAVVLMDGKDISVSPYATNPGGLQEGDSILLLTNPSGSSGYADKYLLNSEFEQHQNSSKYAHPNATIYQSGFMSAADKVALGNAAPSSDGKWYAKILTTVPPSASFDSVAYSSSLHRIVVSRMETTNTSSLIYSDDGGYTWSISYYFGNYNSSAGPIFWIEDLKKFFTVKGYTAEYNAYYSYNGTVSWIPSYGLELTDLNAIAWSSTLQVAIASGRKTGQNKVFKSYDLADWTPADLAPVSGTQGMRVVCRSDSLGIFVVFPYASTDPTQYSETGDTWLASDGFCIPGAYNSAIWIEELSLFVAGGVSAGGYYPSMIISNDGKNWRLPKNHSVFNAANIIKVEWCKEIGIAYAVSLYATFWTTDGENWSKEASSGTSLTFTAKTGVWVSRSNSILISDDYHIKHILPESAPTLGRRTLNLARLDNPVYIKGTTELHIGDCYTKRFCLTADTTLVIGEEVRTQMPVGTSFSVTIDKDFTFSVTMPGGQPSDLTVQGSPAFATSAYIIKRSGFQWDVIYSSSQRNTVTDLGNFSAYTLEIDLSLGEYFRINLEGSPSSFSIMKRPAAGYAMKAYVEITQGINSATIPWPSEFRWEGTAPTIPSTPGAVCVLEIISVTDGTFWDAKLTIRG